MKLKISLVLGLLVLPVTLIQSKSDATLIGRFDVDARDLVGKLKTFINNSKYDLIVRWRVTDLETGRFYSQEPILRRGDSISINYDPAIASLADIDKLEHSLELLRVRQMPKGAGHPLVTTKMKDGSLALAIHKTKFLKNDTFAFALNKSGLLVCKASKTPAL